MALDEPDRDDCGAVEAWDIEVFRDLSRESKTMSNRSKLVRYAKLISLIAFATITMLGQTTKPAT